MRCPKCQYISFDQAERCRNCGYDFSLAPDATSLELPIQTGDEALGPLGELSLNPSAGQRDPGPSPAGRAIAPDTGSLELPLFKRPGDDDRPLVTPSATPRAPLSVRRGAPAAPRVKARRDAPPDEPRLALETAEMPVVPEPEAHAATPVADEVTLPGTPAPVGARLAAGAIDLLIIGGVDAAVLYFTLKICDLTFQTAGTLPLAPFLAFLLLVNGGYFASFIAAGGQTIGKMAAGLRVVPGDPAAGAGERVSLGIAIVRAAAYLVSALPAGLGFLPGILGHERRALHDRLADTRVVKV
jgi:uncharacterized RDD family membrane protein YckC